MPLTYTDCPLYGLKSNKMLKRLLRIEDSKFLKQDYVASMVSPYIDKKGKPRLIEPPREELKIIQKRIKQMLGQIIVPDNVFSGIEGRSYADNAVMTVYVDDVTFSSENRISRNFKDKIVAIVRKYGYQISKSKVKKVHEIVP